MSCGFCLGGFSGFSLCGFLIPVFRGLVPVWRLVTKPKEDRGSQKYDIEKAWDLAKIRQFFRFPGSKN